MIGCLEKKCHMFGNVHLEAHADMHNTEFSRLKVWSIAPFFIRSHVPLMSCWENMCWHTENNMMLTWERRTMHRIGLTVTLTIIPSAATLGTISLTHCTWDCMTTVVLVCIVLRSRLITCWGLCFSLAPLCQNSVRPFTRDAFQVRSLLNSWSCKPVRSRRN